jgi:precorrin-6B methylase 2
MIVPFVPTPPYVARKMLEIAALSSDDVLADLGCGDGRIVEEALKAFGVKKAICVEIREDLARAAAKRLAPYGERAVVINGDLMAADLAGVTVVTLFLLTSVNKKLRPHLEAQLAPGARVVSHEFPIPGWQPVVFATVHDGRISHDIYLYILR